MKQKTFGLFSQEAIDDKIASYNALGDSLETDIKTFADNKAELTALFNSPQTFKNGNELKTKLQRLLEMYYLKSLETKNKTAQELLIYLFYGFYKSIDSLILQEALVYPLEKASDIDQPQYDMLKFFYSFNSTAFANNYDENNIIRRINNQRRILNYFLAYDSDEHIKQLEEQAENSDIQTQLMKNALIETSKSINLDYYSLNLHPEELELVKTFLVNSASAGEFFEEIGKFRFFNIGYSYIRSLNNNKKALYRLAQNTDLATEFRLYLLLKIYSHNANLFDFEYNLSSLKSKLNKDKAVGEFISQEFEEEIRSSTEKILNDASNDKLSTGDNYLDSLEAEMLFAAAAVALHEQYADFNLADFLKQLKYTFVRDGNTEYIVNYAGSSESELFRIPMASGEEYINSIRDLVDNLYKKAKGIKYDFGGKIKSDAKGVLSAIKKTARANILNLVLLIMFSGVAGNSTAEIIYHSEMPTAPTAVSSPSTAHSDVSPGQHPEYWETINI